MVGGDVGFIAEFQCVRGDDPGSATFRALPFTGDVVARSDVAGIELVINLGKLGLAPLAVQVLAYAARKPALLVPNSLSLPLGPSLDCFDAGNPVRSQMETFQLPGDDFSPDGGVAGGFPLASGREVFRCLSEVEQALGRDVDHGWLSSGGTLSNTTGQIK